MRYLVVYKGGSEGFDTKSVVGSVRCVSCRDPEPCKSRLKCGPEPCESRLKCGPETSESRLKCGPETSESRLKCGPETCEYRSDYDTDTRAHETNIDLGARLLISKKQKALFASMTWTKTEETE